MADVFNTAKRSKVMSLIRSSDTAPERKLRRVLHRLGFRFCLSTGSKVFGKPDVVLPRYRTAIFMHGCFWHRHHKCKYCYTPKSRLGFWERKFAANQARDRKVCRTLRGEGWKVVIVWECQLGNTLALEKRLMRIRCRYGNRTDARTIPRRRTSKNCR